MATVSISPLLPSRSAMSSRRLPLGNNPNGANSPYRPLGSVATKQKRSYATIQREESYGHAPPAKKQMLSSHQTLRTPPRQVSHYHPEPKVVTRKITAPQSSTFERTGRTTVRDRSAQQTVSKQAKTSEQNSESHLAWQKHYRQVFPTYVFYFEGVSEDVRHKYAKQVTSVGARVEKFFSNLVTHVVTTRNIPPEVKSDLKGSSAPSSATNDTRSENSQPRTIDPSLLDRSSESTYGQSDSFGAKGKFTFEAPLNRRLPHHVETESKGQQGRNSDVLQKARSLGMKIWALEKLQRIMSNLLDPNGSQIPHGHDTRSNAISGTALRGADLSQLLRDERINGPSDRDPTVATKEITQFKGPFIYIHDIDERQKPIMVREYSKVTNKMDGDWPQFRSVANGKCPFVNDEPNRKDIGTEKEAARAQKKQIPAPRTRAAAAGESIRMDPPKAVTNQRTLTEMPDGSNRNVTVSSKQSNPFNSTRGQQSRRTEPVSSSKGNAFVSRAGAARLFAGEPVASGIQPSHITSAIRSTMSSTAAQPGAKAGTSKEIHGLQRKVLEKNSGGHGSYTSSHRINEHAAPTGTSRRKQANLDLIEEDADPSEAEEQARKVENTRNAKAVQQRKIEQRDAKPGYCENCQDKFEDFDEHILARKHRKFAERDENWKELDSLLDRLARPLRVNMDD